MASTTSKWTGAGERRDKVKKAAALQGYSGMGPEIGRNHQLKKYSLQKGFIYGPVQSRLLGASLGMTVFSTDYKLCSFNCNYCPYGWIKKKHPPATGDFIEIPSVNEIVTAMALTLEQLSGDGKTIDSITICGNGEPTVYPNLSEVLEMTKQLRDRYQPQAQLAMFSNSSTVGNKAIREALELLDVKIMKFDAGSEELFQQLNHPREPIYMGDIVSGLKELKNVYLQSLFVQGRIANADPDSVGLWIERVRDIRPLGVHVYTLDRETADKKIEKVSLTTLQWIADQVRWRAGVPAEVLQ